MSAISPTDSSRHCLSDLCSEIYQWVRQKSYRPQRQSCRVRSMLRVEELEIRTLLAVTIPGTFDFFKTDPGDTSIDIGTEPAGDNPPLPAGFFGTIGSDPSDPFSMAGIPLEGNPPVDEFQRFPPPTRLEWVDPHGNPVGPNSIHAVGQEMVTVNVRNYDTVVERINDAEFSGLGDTPQVNIEIVALSLMGVEPIVVTYGTSGVKLWDVFVTLDDTAVQPVGSMDLTSDTFVDGVSVSGTIDNLDLPVAFKVTFQEVQNPGNVIEIPSALANPTPPFGLPPAQFTNTPGFFQFPVGELVVEKHDTLVGDVDGDGVADPGDTLEYSVGIGNFTQQDLTNLQLHELVTTDFTVDPGSVKVSPLANDDSYSTIGNFPFDSDALGIPSVLSNDEDFDDGIGIDTFVTDFDAISAAGGNVSVNPNGSFTYDPPVGFTGTDKFAYTLTDPDGLIGTGFVDIEVQQRVWFIDGDDGDDALGDGTFGSPWQTPAPFNALSLPGDIAYVMDDGGAGTSGGFLLKDGQGLLGQGVPLERFGTTFVPAGNRPTIGSPGSNGINLGQGNLIRGLNVDSPSGAGIVGLTVGPLIIDQVGVTAAGGSGVDLRNGTGVDITLDSITVGDILNPGLAAVRFDNVSGIVRVNGDTMITDVEGVGLAAVGNAAFQLEQGGHLTISNIGSSGIDGVTIDLGHPASNVNFDGGLTIDGLNGSDGLVIFQAGTVGIGGTSSSINVAGGGSALLTNNTNTGPSGWTFADITSTGSAFAPGIALSGVAGSLTVDQANISTMHTQGVFLGPGSNVNTTFNNLVVDAIGVLPAVEVAPFAGPGTHRFSGMTLINPLGAGFRAQDGIIEVLGAGNSIINAGDIGLDTFDATIGPGGLTFDSIQTTGAPGSLLTNTGPLGGLSILDGSPLDDIYFGSDGDDALAGGPGEDELNGELGFDTALFNGLLSDFNVTDLGGNDWLVERLANNEVDTLTSIESLQFLDGTIPRAYTQVFSQPPPILGQQVAFPSEQEPLASTNITTSEPPPADSVDEHGQPDNQPTTLVGGPLVLGTLPSNKELTVYFRAIINTLGATQTQIANQAMVTADGGVSVLSDDPATRDERGDPTITEVPQVDLVTTKTDSLDPVPAGSAFSYEVTVTNNGPSTAKDVLVTDTLPTGVTWVSDDGENMPPAGGLLIFDVGDLSAGESVTWTINVTANPAAIGTTQLNRTFASTTTHELNPENNEATEETAIVSNAGVTITESSGSTDVTEGGADDTFDIVLDSTPTAGVDFSLDAGTQLELSIDGVNFFAQLPLTLDDTTPETIHVRAVDDPIVEGNHIGNIEIEISGTTDADYLALPPIPDLPVNITDNDSAGGVEFQLTVNGGVDFTGSTPAQRSQVVSLRLESNVDVDIQPTAFSIENVDGGDAPDSSQLILMPVAGSNSQFDITFGAGLGVDTRNSASPDMALWNSIADGSYRLLVDPSKVTDLATGMLQPATDVVDEFFRKFGDDDGNGFRRRDDANKMIRAFRVPHAIGYNAALDWDGDGGTFRDFDDIRAFYMLGLDPL